MKVMMLATISSEAIWRDFHTPLRGFIRRRVPDDQIADDLLQEVFLRIHTRIETLRDNTRLEAWIYQIARNAVADYYRGLHASTPLTDDLPEPDLERDDLAAQLAPGIRQMLMTLPAAYREAFILTEVNGMSQAELARRLGISVSGAKSRVQRARAHMKRLMLECCHFEFDRLGGVVNYYPRVDCCRRCKCQ
jgi:RNA polymerase sigma-70 factor, ECF subfamily